MADTGFVPENYLRPYRAGRTIPAIIREVKVQTLKDVFMRPKKYWIIVASRIPVQRGVGGGFLQANQ
jgi:hypothetical protein